MSTRPFNYKLFMKLIDRTPSLVIQLKDHNNFEYVIKQADDFSGLKDTYQQLSSNPSACYDGITNYVLPAYHTQHGNAFAG